MDVASCTDDDGTVALSERAFLRDLIKEEILNLITKLESIIENLSENEIQTIKKFFSYL